MRSVTAGLVAGGVLAAACGGQLAPGDAGVDAPDASGCVSGNYAVCGGPEECSPPDCHCYQELESSLSPTTGICASPPGSRWEYPFGDLCSPGSDGHICVLLTIVATTLGWVDAPFELGQLLAANGSADRVRYADLGSWTGEPIPEPSSCPDLGNVRACGGMCGGCTTGEVCVGRSPLHPVGFCDTNHFGECSASPHQGHPGCTTPGDECFVYVVQPEAQAVADDAGKCLPAVDCETLATRLPGGGKCSGAN